ncbi:hypothetical protein O988_05617 [Pseudogymnoascus sp. VKM F-3808]|nr:hypothetical protein O988_05617 [Pseudogymnoascus sp. VKM F-3808]
MASQRETDRPGRSSPKPEDVPSHSASTLAAIDTEAGAIEGSFNAADDNKGTAPPMTFPEGGARGWTTTAGAAGVLFCTFGYINTFGFYQEYYQSHQLSGETPSAISWIGSLQGFFIFSGSLVGGPLFDRYGEKVLWPPALIYVFSIFMTSISTKYWHFILAQGILGGMSMGMTMAPAMAAVPQYFQKKRGAAMGATIAGSSVGGVILPIMLGKMLNGNALSFGWAVRVVGFLMLAILSMSCLFIKARLPPRKGTFFLPGAFKNLEYVAVVAAGFLMVFGFFGPFIYLPVYAVQQGMSKLLASYVLSILNAASFFGRVVPGIMADKVGRYNTLFVAAIASGILIFCWPLITTNAGIIVFAVLFGFFSGTIISGIMVCLASCARDPREIGTYIGMGLTLGGVAVLIGPPINGALLTEYSGFHEISWLMGAVTMAGAVSVVLAKWLSGGGIFAKL